MSRRRCDTCSVYPVMICQWMDCFRTSGGTGGGRGHNRCRNFEGWFSSSNILINLRIKCRITNLPRDLMWIRVMPMSTSVWRPEKERHRIVWSLCNIIRKVFYGLLFPISLHLLRFSSGARHTAASIKLPCSALLRKLAIIYGTTLVKNCTAAEVVL